MRVPPFRQCIGGQQHDLWGEKIASIFPSSPLLAIYQIPHLSIVKPLTFPLTAPFQPPFLLLKGVDTYALIAIVPLWFPSVALMHPHYGLPNGYGVAFKMNMLFCDIVFTEINIKMMW